MADDSPNLMRLNHDLQPLGAVLAYDATDILCLHHTSFVEPIFVDIHRALRRQQAAAHHREFIARACLVDREPVLVDVTAGLGRDGLLLAAMGCQVTLIERHPVLHALLQDGVKRWHAQSMDLPRIRLIHDCSVRWLARLVRADYPQVIYMDPMHPQREKTAQVKKQSQILRLLAGEDLDKAQLATLAQSRVTQRLVVKWPKRAPTLLQDCNHQLLGERVRFDIFLPKVAAT